jgi:hypothetical protein
MAWKWDEFAKLGFTPEQVSILQESVGTLESEMSTSVKLNEILEEIRKVTSNDLKQSVTTKINEADKDEEDEEVTDDTAVEPESDTEEVPTEDETAVEPESDAEEVPTEDETAVEPESDTEEIASDDEMLDDITDEDEITDEPVDDMEDFNSDEENDIDDELEDETMEDEEMESPDDDDIDKSNMEYAQGELMGTYDRGYADGYNDAFNDRAIYDSIVNEMKAKKETEGKTNVSEQVKPVVTPKVEPKVATKVKPIVEQKVNKADVKMENKTEKVKPVVATKCRDLSEKELKLQSLFEEFEIPPQTDGRFHQEIINEQIEIERLKKENIIVKYLSGLTPLKQLEVKPLLEEMSRKIANSKDLQELIQVMPQLNSKSNVEKKDKINESIEKSQHIYNTSKDDSVAKATYEIFNKIGSF